jgi:hypothetical protein
MRQMLKLHPESRCEAVTAIDVEVQQTADGLSLRYRLRGDVSRLVIPQAEEPRRADELWRHTCFEAFLGGEGAAYRELNFSPSRCWAAYDFDGYRAGMRPAMVEPPGVEVANDTGGLELTARIAAAPGPLSLGLSAVIEEVGGRISYWALAHSQGRPDFHSPDCFALSLTAVERP